MPSKRLNDAETLQLYGVSLSNVTTQPKIAEIMTDYGFDSKALAAGLKLLAETQQAYNTNQEEDDETMEGHKYFSSVKAELASTYASHRKKAKVVFRKDSVAMEKLVIIGSIPQPFANWLDKVKKFYTVMLSNEAY